ncbi:MAG: hypothetical protein ACFB8W_20115 [Elainellaceae cyanobacterium]
MIIWYDEEYASVVLKGAIQPMEFIEDMLEKLREWVRKVLDALFGPEPQAEPEPIPVPVDDRRRRR